MEAGPYGITQFDAAGLINNYQVAKQNRIQMMVAQKQLERLDKQTKDEEGVRKAVSAYYGGASQAAPQSATAPFPTQPAAPKGADREKLFGQLMAVDPETATHYMDAFAKMDKAQIDRYTQTSARITQFAGGLLQLPQAQRAAALQQAAPEAQQLGYTPEQLAHVDLSDNGLRQIMVSHMDADKIAAFVKPEYHSTSQGGSLQVTTPSGGVNTVYESPTVEVGGDVYNRPAGMSSMPRPMTATNPKTGEKIQFNPQTNAWEPMGGQPVTPAGGFP